MQVNPNSYGFKYKSLGNQPLTRANSKQHDKSNIPDAKELKLVFHLDSTGVIPGCDDVAAAIDKFKKYARM